jgi:hypothetical protein
MTIDPRLAEIDLQVKILDKKREEILKEATVTLFYAETIEQVKKMAEDGISPIEYFNRYEQFIESARKFQESHYWPKSSYFL